MAGPAPRFLKPKRADIGPLLINCSIRGEDFINCICDTGASISVMPLSTARRLQLQDCRTRPMSLRMVDQTTVSNCVVMIDVPVMIEDVVVPTDFAIVDMNPEPRNPLILGRPFLQTTDALLDLSTGTVTLRFDCVSFKRDDAASILMHEAFMVDIEKTSQRRSTRSKGTSSSSRSSRRRKRDPTPPPQYEWMEKKGDPGALHISCSIKDTVFSNCLCDTGATLSVMPYTIAERLGLISSIPSSVRVRMADNTLARNHGIISDVRVLIDGVTIPTDFIVVHTESEPDYDLLFGRSFLHTTGAQLDMDHSRVTLALRPGDQTASTSTAATINISSGDESSEEEEEGDDFWESDPEIFMLESSYQEEGAKKARELSINTFSPSWDPYPTKLMTDHNQSRRGEIVQREDSGALTLPCTVANVSFPKCMVDTGASMSVMPLSIAERLGFRNVPDEEITIRLADQSEAENHGVIQSVPVTVEGVEVPTDFVVIKMAREPAYGLLLGRSFLQTTCADIDMMAGTVTLNLGTSSRTIFTRYGSVLKTASEEEEMQSEEEEEDQVWDPEIERSPLRSPSPA